MAKLANACELNAHSLSDSAKDNVSPGKGGEGGGGGRCHSHFSGEVAWSAGIADKPHRPSVPAPACDLMGSFQTPAPKSARKAIANVVHGRGGCESVSQSEVRGRGGLKG